MWLVFAVRMENLSLELYDERTVKPVLTTIHSGDMEIAIDRWLLVAEWKCYFHLAISNHLSEMLVFIWWLNTGLTV